MLLRVLVCLLVLLQTFASSDAAADETRRKAVLLASTIGPIDAGIVGALEEAFKAKTGIVVEHTGAGTGKAIQMAETGKYDLLLVHAKALEEKFVADGFGTKRYDLMVNDFVILGPASDPAKIRGMRDAAAALAAIARAQGLFITRGDKSGTHVKELEVWKKAGVEPQGAWYLVFPDGAKGNVATTAFTNEKQAYTVMDRATYITMKTRITLQILVERDDVLLNYMTLIPVNPAKFPSVNHTDAMRFVEWLQGREAQMIIRDFGKNKYGEPLFFPNSPEGKKL